MPVYRQMTLTFRPEEAARIEQAAEDRGISKTELLRRAVEAYLNKAGEDGQGVLCIPQTTAAAVAATSSGRGLPSKKKKKKRH